jgi:hypothetical protein
MLLPGGIPVEVQVYNPLISIPPYGQPADSPYMYDSLSAGGPPVYCSGQNAPPVAATDMPQQSPYEVDFLGEDFTVGVVVLSGSTQIYCCDENYNLLKASYSKLCFGLAAEVSAAAMAGDICPTEKCPSQCLTSGWEIGGGLGPFTFGGTVSSSGQTGSLAGGLGLGGGIMFCEYEYELSEVVGCCELGNIGDLLVPPLENIANFISP